MDKEQFEYLVERYKETMEKFEKELAEAKDTEEMAYAYARKAGALSALVSAYEIDVRYDLEVRRKLV